MFQNDTFYNTVETCFLPEDVSRERQKKVQNNNTFASGNFFDNMNENFLYNNDAQGYSDYNNNTQSPNEDNDYDSGEQGEAGGGDNLTSVFNQQVSEMKAVFGSIGEMYNNLYGGPILSYPAKFTAFGYIQYKGAATEFMNPKAFDKSPFTKNNGGYVNGEFFAPDDFGNYFYGAAAHAMGITLFDAVHGAGAYAIFNGSVTDWTNLYGFFDERKDTQMIIRGYYGK